MSSASPAGPVVFNPSRPRPDRILLFDVDGTLTAPRLEVEDEMRAWLAGLRERTRVGIVGGSDLVKQQEQLGRNSQTRTHEHTQHSTRTHDKRRGHGALRRGSSQPQADSSPCLSLCCCCVAALPLIPSSPRPPSLRPLLSPFLSALSPRRAVVSEWDYVFSENGLVAFKSGAPLAVQSLKAHLGEARLKSLLNFILHYIADLDIPIKRGTFVEFRAGMINVSPIGRNCSQAEREEFERYDAVHKIRSTFVSVLQSKFADLNLTYSIGGQISFDVFPSGWDKTYCLRFLEADGFKEVHFFGDKTSKGGNDYEIFEDARTVGHTVTSWRDTIKQVEELLAKDAAQ